MKTAKSSYKILKTGEFEKKHSHRLPLAEFLEVQFNEMGTSSWNPSRRQLGRHGICEVKKQIKISQYIAVFQIKERRFVAVKTAER